MRLPMNLRWTSYVAPKPPKGAQKRKTAIFCVKLHFNEESPVAWLWGTAAGDTRIKLRNVAEFERTEEGSGTNDVGRWELWRDDR